MTRWQKAVGVATIMVPLTMAVVAAQHASGGAAAEPQKTPASPTAPAAGSKPKPPDMKKVVERIQQRIEDEVVKPAAARSATTPKRSATSAHPSAVPEASDAATARRIRLSWRVSLVWPADLSDRP
jgi:hypothetical protein